MPKRSVDLQAQGNRLTPEQAHLPGDDLIRLTAQSFETRLPQHISERLGVREIDQRTKDE